MVFEKLETGKYVTAKFAKHPKPEMLEEVNSFSKYPSLSRLSKTLCVPSELCG